MYIAIAGNIGSGKTTLTQILTKRYDAKCYLEECDNPYIGDFYEDMNRWAFNLQISFLGSRIQQTMEEAIANAQKTAEKFAANSKSKLNKIVSADQGQFSIDDRDQTTPYIKKVRVVTTIVYSLKD